MIPLQCRSLIAPFLSEVTKKKKKKPKQFPFLSHPILAGCVRRILNFSIRYPLVCLSTIYPKMCFSRAVVVVHVRPCTVVPTKSDSDVMFSLQSYQGLRIDISILY